MDMEESKIMSAEAAGTAIAAAVDVMFMASWEVLDITEPVQILVVCMDGREVQVEVMCHVCPLR